MEKIMFLDYETLRLIWWGLLGFIFIGFAVMGGIDLGIGTLLPFITRDEVEKRIVINVAAPTWESNQIWFILGGGATFAAWPFIYSVSFTILYVALFLVLVALILRPVGFDYRGQIENVRWKKLWDTALFIGGFIPSLVFGIAVGNVLQGVSFSYNEYLQLENKSEFFQFFTPFTLLCGLLSGSMFIVQGASFLAMKTKAEILKRTLVICYIFPVITIILFALGGYMVSKMNGYVILSLPGTELPSNPMFKTVMTEVGGWLLNYKKYQWFILAPILGFLGSGMVIIFCLLRINWGMWISNSISIIGIVSTVGLSMFPFILPSNFDYKASLTVWDASSSYLSLFIMLFVTAIFIPLILLYVSWAYKIMFGRIDRKYIKDNDQDLY